VKLGSPVGQFQKKARRHRRKIAVFSDALMQEGKGLIGIFAPRCR